MLSIATLFDDEQQLLNHVWVILLGLQALLVLFGTISALVRGVMAMRRSSKSNNNTGIIANTRRGGLRRTSASPWQYPRHVTIELPATVYEYNDKTGGYSYEYDYHYDYDAYDDGYAEAYSNNSNYDEYEYSEKYARSARAGTPDNIPNSPSSRV